MPAFVSNNIDQKYNKNYILQINPLQFWNKIFEDKKCEFLDLLGPIHEQKSIKSYARFRNLNTNY